MEVIKRYIKRCSRLGCVRVEVKRTHHTLCNNAIACYQPRFDNFQEYVGRSKGFKFGAVERIKAQRDWSLQFLMKNTNKRRH